MLLEMLALAFQPAAPITSVQPGAPPAAHISASVRAARLLQARWLVELFHPEPAMVASNMAMWEIQVRRSSEEDRALSKIEREYPGAIDAYIAGARPVAVENATAFVRAAKALKVSVLADRLSGADLARLIDFYRGPVGAKVVRLQQKPGEIARLLRQTRSGDLPPIDATVIERDRESQVKRAVGGLSADELVQVLKFQSDPVAIRYADAIRAADERLLVLLQHPDETRLAREHQAGTRALDAHIARLKQEGN